MVIRDKGLVFSTAQAETTQAAHDSDDVVDLRIANANLGAGTPKWLVVTVNTTFTSGGAGTLTVALQDCATVGGSYATVIAGEAHALASLVKGFKLLCIPLPAEHARFLKLVYTIGGAAMTAGAVDAYITTAPQTA
jgi:hypothetical protein